MPFHSLPLRVSAQLVRGGKLHIEAETTGSDERQPIVLILVLDNSGSMGESAGGGGEGAAYSRLDLVKHSARVMASMLRDDDILIVIRFSADARTILPPTLMNMDGRAFLHSVLDGVWPDSSTNLFAGLQEAANWASDAAFADAHIACMVLTDGFPTVEPPRGTLHMLNNGSLRVANPWTVHTFGFGYSLDSKLLAGVAEWGGGLFGFIPDCSMVGTVFINALAHILCTGNLGTTVEYGSPACPAQKRFGPLALGQPRGLLVDLPAATDLTNLFVNYEGETQRVWEDAALEPTDPTLEFVGARTDYLGVLARIIDNCKTGCMAGVAEAERVLADFVDRWRTSDDARVKALLRDVRSPTEGEGQVGMAPTYFGRWGEHYLRAYKRSQELQQCMNFKDPGLQIYGGTLFHQLQEDGDRLFCTLPAPKPTGAGAGAGAGVLAVASMAVFHNPSGGCFGPETRIRMADGKEKKITEIGPGDRVATPTGPATIVALVTCGSVKRSQPMSKMDDLFITPWHPVRVEGAWRFPADIVGYSDRLMPKVYNLVLDGGHIVYAEGVEACTLGHGFTEPVVAHPFFGTERVIEDLRKLPGWSTGWPTFDDLMAVRDPDTDMICGWVDRAAE